MRILYSNIEKKHIYADQNQRKGSGLFLFGRVHPRRTAGGRFESCKKAGSVERNFFQKQNRK